MTIKDPEERYLNREISWLSFNHRVLQEAMDPRVPLYERLNFLAIFSSNLDEFYRVRVAGIRSLLRLKRKKLEKLDFRPGQLLREITATVNRQQELFGETFRSQLIPALARHGVDLVDERELDESQAEFLREHFRKTVQPALTVLRFQEGQEPPFLEDGHIYLATELWADEEVTVAGDRPDYALVEIPSGSPGSPGVLGRFSVLPGRGMPVIFLDDVIRFCLAELFPGYDVGRAYAVKLSRDADLYLEDEFSGDLVKKIEKSLNRRETGHPSRFLYDQAAPFGMLNYLKTHLGLEDDDLIPGGRYHNLDDFFDFPRIPTADLRRDRLEPLAHPVFSKADSMLAAIAEKDRLLSVPYQSYEPVLRFLDEATADPSVQELWITLYRVAADSEVVKALIRAARAGMRVTAFVEVKARFDEARNLKWAGEMEEAGVRCIYSMPGLKVHAKIALAVRSGGGAPEAYAFFSTGNFNEKTARLYADHGLFTADPRLTREARKVFAVLEGEEETPDFEHLLVAPFALRDRFTALIRREIEHERAGRDSGMVLKMNSLEDRGMIDLLYEASQAGVRTQLIVRGICCLRPGIRGLSDEIEARSIVDRFLEHSRIFRFENDGAREYYLSSADWMYRNLERRIEVAFPIYDPDVARELEAILRLQLADNSKARILDADQVNEYVPTQETTRVEAQVDTYRLLSGRR